MSIPTAPHESQVGTPRVSPDDTRELRVISSRSQSEAWGSSLAPYAVTAVLWAIAAVTAWLALRTWTGQQLDEWALQDAQALESTRLIPWLAGVLDFIPLIGVVGCASAAIVAGVRTRRVGSAVALLVTAVLSVVSVQVLKLVLLEKPDLGIQEVATNSFPSGHVSVASIVSFVIVLATPPRGRSWAVLAGSAFTALVGIATVLTAWHRPSDAVAAILVSAGWSVLAAVFLRSHSPVASRRTGKTSLIVSVAPGVAALVIAVVLGLVQLWWQSPWGALGAGIAAITAFALLSTALVASQAERRGSH